MAPSKRQPAGLAGTIAAVEGALCAHDMAKAIELSQEAVAAGAEHPTLLCLTALKHMRAGDNGRALPLLLRARALAPRHVDLLNALGTCLARLGRPRQALEAFDAALGQAKEPRLYFGRALALEDLSELDRAAESFAQALALDPGLSEALARLALIAVQRGDAAGARRLAIRALAINPRETAARIGLVQALLAQKQFDAARETLTVLLDEATLAPVDRAFALSLAGDLCDAQDRTADAFVAYARSKAILRAHFVPTLEGGQGVAARELRLARYFRRADPLLWQAGPAPPPASPTHIFLIGFPRSGTTLLEQVLAAHPEVMAMEERPCLMDSAAAFFGSDSDLDRLAKTGQEALAPWRAAYWQRVRETAGAPTKPVFVDKLPLNAVFLPLIAKLFPTARIVLSLRDPRDVVWSCFRRRFAMNAAMAQFATVQSTAAYYALVMELLEVYRRLLALPLLEVRHETLLADFEGEVRRVCDFLGLAPAAAMGRFAERARERTIDTPSGAQLAAGLSTTGLGQWRRYQPALAPVFPLLAPFVARFGYPEN